MFRLFRVRGHSMSPSLRHGDVVIIKRQRRGYHVGQVIVAHHDSLGAIIKRIKRVAPDGYEVEGDHPDSTAGIYLGCIQPSQIAGRVIFPAISQISH